MNRFEGEVIDGEDTAMTAGDWAHVTRVTDAVTARTTAKYEAGKAEHRGAY